MVSRTAALAILRYEFLEFIKLGKKVKGQPKNLFLYFQIRKGNRENIKVTLISVLKDRHPRRNS